MNKIFLFMMVSLDGLFEGTDHDLSWHNVDAEFNTFAAKQMQEAGAILFGRRTYELMESFWPSYQASDQDNIIVKEQLDTLPKFVFSKTLQSVTQTPDWQNVTLLHEVNQELVTKLKNQYTKDIVVLGSSELCISLLKLNLLDELRIMVNPVVVGKGKKLFDGIEASQKFTHIDTRNFASGNVLLRYTATHSNQAHA